MNTQIGSLEHFGQIFCPPTLVGILTQPAREVIDVEYIEIESALFGGSGAIELDAAGLKTLSGLLDGKPDGKHSVGFSYLHGDRDLEVSGEVSLKGGEISWHCLDATSEDGDEYPVTFDAAAFNRDYTL